MKLILNAPCFPKKSYHVGNAVSQIISDIVYRNLKASSKDVKFVCHSWNLHGKSPENTCNEEKGGVCNYQEILKLVLNYSDFAIKEKSFFVEYDTTNNSDFIEYFDTNLEFVKYTQDTFQLLVSKKLLVENADNYFLDLKAVQEQVGGIAQTIGILNIFPNYHKNTLISIGNTLNSYYPITKDRVFTVKVKQNGKEFSLNPIFQSLIMPLYLAEKYHTETPAYLMTSASGHSLLKWHFIRSLLTTVLTNSVPYENLILHGTILGQDGKPISKHSAEVTQPSMLFELENDRSFVRYVLLKSISINDIKLQLDASRSEFLKIKRKLKLLESGGTTSNISVEAENLLVKSQNLLDNFMIKQALEAFYLALRMTDIVDENNVSNDKMHSLYKIFLSPKF